jgi:hypothetical protein
MDELNLKKMPDTELTALSDMIAVEKARRLDARDAALGEFVRLKSLDNGTVTEVHRATAIKLLRAGQVEVVA